MKSGPRKADQPLMRMHTAAVISCALLLAGTAHGQSHRLERVEEIWGDAGPLNQSLRVLPLDMRHPTGFEHVYRVPGSIHGESMMARMDGAITAVFPASVYSATRRGGIIPLTPPGTVFYIGAIPDQGSDGVAKSIASPLSLQRRINLGIDTGRPSDSVPIGTPLRAKPISYAIVQTESETPTTGSTQQLHASPAASLWDSERVRRESIGALISGSSR